MSVVSQNGGMDKQTAVRLKKKLAEEFRDQLTWGIPTNEDEAGLRRLASQIRAKKVIVKLFLKHPQLPRWIEWAESQNRLTQPG
jgi:hypothetical protein